LGGLRANLDKTIQDLTALDVFTTEEEMGDDGGLTGRMTITLSSEERRIGRETFGIVSTTPILYFETFIRILVFVYVDFYCFLIWPFIETYWLGAVSCFALIPEKLPATELTWMDERVFTNRAQFFGKTLYYEGKIKSIECVLGLIFESYFR
jgi:hypothetical protein